MNVGPRYTHLGPTFMSRVCRSATLDTYRRYLPNSVYSQFRSSARSTR